MAVVENLKTKLRKLTGLGAAFSAASDSVAEQLAELRRGQEVQQTKIEELQRAVDCLKRGQHNF